MAKNVKYLPTLEGYVKAGYAGQNYEGFIKEQTTLAKEAKLKVVINDKGEDPDEKKNTEEAEQANAERPAHFPVQPKVLQNGEHSSALERMKIWARQAKAGTITLCTFKSEDGKQVCYHPLDSVRDPKKDNAPKTVTKTNGMGVDVKCIVARCSFDPSHHGEQYIFPKVKEDDLDETFTK